jgi:hypothetical protein
MLVDYLDELSRAKWAWGVCDCTQAVSQWIDVVHGVDPFAQFQYSNAEEARACVKRHGGFVCKIGQVLDDCGFERTQTYEDGDVAIIQAPRVLATCMPVVGAIMAIRHRDLWIMKALHGIVGRDVPAVSAWRI